MIDFEYCLGRLREDHEPWLNFGRLLINIKLEELKKGLGAYTVGEMIEGKLKVPDDVDIRARGILNSVLSGGTEESIAISFTNTGLSIFGLNPASTVHICVSGNPPEDVLQTAKYAREVFLEDATSFTLFKAANDIIDCLTGNLRVGLTASSTA